MTILLMTTPLAVPLSQSTQFTIGQSADKFRLPRGMRQMRDPFYAPDLRGQRNGAFPARDDGRNMVVWVHTAERTEADHDDA